MPAETAGAAVLVTILEAVQTTGLFLSGRPVESSHFNCPLNLGSETLQFLVMTWNNPFVHCKTSRQTAGSQ